MDEPTFEGDSDWWDFLQYYPTDADDVIFPRLKLLSIADVVPSAAWYHTGTTRGG